MKQIFSLLVGVTLFCSDSTQGEYVSSQDPSVLLINDCVQAGDEDVTYMFNYKEKKGVLSLLFYLKNTNPKIFENGCIDENSNVFKKITLSNGTHECGYTPHGGLEVTTDPNDPTIYCIVPVMENFPKKIKFSAYLSNCHGSRKDTIEVNFRRSVTISNTC